MSTTSQNKKIPNSLPHFQKLEDATTSLGSIGKLQVSQTAYWSLADARICHLSPRKSDKRLPEYFEWFDRGHELGER